MYVCTTYVHKRHTINTVSAYTYVCTLIDRLTQAHTHTPKKWAKELAMSWVAWRGTAVWDYSKATPTQLTVQSMLSSLMYKSTQPLSSDVCWCEHHSVKRRSKESTEHVKIIHHTENNRLIGPFATLIELCTTGNFKCIHNIQIVYLVASLGSGQAHLHTCYKVSY